MTTFIPHIPYVPWWTYVPWCSDVPGRYSRITSMIVLWWYIWFSMTRPSVIIFSYVIPEWHSLCSMMTFPRFCDDRLERNNTKWSKTYHPITEDVVSEYVTIEHYKCYYGTGIIAVETETNQSQEVLSCNIGNVIMEVQFWSYSTFKCAKNVKSNL